MAWNKLLPVAGEKARLISGQIRDNNAGLESAVNAEHIFNGSTAATQTGHHRQGTARCFFQDSAPATNADGTAFESTDLGLLWFDTNSTPDNIAYVLTATTPTWTPLSTEIIAVLLASARVFGSTLGVTGDFAVGSNKFTVAGSSGNTNIAGSLDIVGNLDPTSFAVSNGGFINEDSMATNSPVKAPSQQSVKAYVDAKETTINAVIANQGCKGWANVTGAGVVNASYNVTSVVRNSAGVYTVTWATNFADANYAPMATILQNTDRCFIKVTNLAAGTCIVRIQDFSTVATDLPFSIAAFGTQ